MRMGVAVFLVALGAIFAYATNWHISGLNLHTVGAILMIVGIAWGAISFFVYQQQRHGTIVRRRRRLDDDPMHPGEVVYEESSDIDRPVGNQNHLYDEVLHPGRAVSYPPPEVLEDPPSGENDPRL